MPFFKALFCKILIVCVPFQAFGAPEPAALRVGIIQEWDVLHPLIWTTYPSAMIASSTSRDLVKATESGDFEPGLIEKIPTVEKQKNSVILKIQIKKEAKWGDGAPVVCDDLKLSWEIGIHPNSSVMSRDAYEQIEKVEWPSTDPKSCQVTFKKNRYLLAETGWPSLIPAHLERVVFEKYKDQGVRYSTETLFLKAPTNPGLYNGPYVVSEMVRGSHVVLKKNPYWSGQEPKIEKIFFKYFPSTDALINEMKSGGINFSGAIGLTAEQAQNFESVIENSKLPLKVDYESQSDLERFIFNLDDPFLRDPILRQVLAYSLDRNTLVRIASREKFEVTDHPVVSTFSKKAFGKLPSLTRREAIAKLEKAGYKLGPDGFRTKNGKTVELNLATTSGNRTRETNLTFIADQWKQLGIKTMIKNYPARILIGQKFRCRDYTGGMEMAFGSMPNSVRKDAYASSHIPTPENKCTGLNGSGWRNKTVDQVIESLGTEFSPEKRQRLLETFVREYQKDVPEIPLYMLAHPVIYPASLKGSVKTGPYGLNLSRIETWGL